MRCSKEQGSFEPKHTTFTAGEPVYFSNSSALVSEGWCTDDSQRRSVAQPCCMVRCTWRCFRGFMSIQSGIIGILTRYIRNGAQQCRHLTVAVSKKSISRAAERKRLSMAIPPCPLGPLDSLGGSLSSTPISLAVRRAIINTVFDLELTEDDFQTRNNGFEAYFDDWYEEQCEAAAGQVSVKTQRDILDVIACLQRRSASDSRAVIATILNQTDLRFGSGKRLGASIILAARLWLVISIGTFQHSQTPGRIVPWGEGALTDSIGEAFRVSSSCTDIVKFPKSFNAASVERVAGIKICWTSNLADHLSMEDDDTKVMMFHQMSFLELHRNPRRLVCSTSV